MLAQIQGFVNLLDNIRHIVYQKVDSVLILRGGKLEFKPGRGIGFKPIDAYNEFDMLSYFRLAYERGERLGDNITAWPTPELFKDFSTLKPRKDKPYEITFALRSTGALYAIGEDFSNATRLVKTEDDWTTFYKMFKTSR